MPDRLSITFLTVDFLGGSSLSINYYIATLLQFVEDFFELEKVTIFSHQEGDSQDNSLPQIMHAHNLTRYYDRVEVVTLNCFEWDKEGRDLGTYDLIVCTAYHWGYVVEQIKRIGLSKPKIIYWLPSILWHEYIVSKQESNMKQRYKCIKPSRISGAKPVVFNFWAT